MRGACLWGGRPPLGTLSSRRRLRMLLQLLLGGLRARTHTLVCVVCVYVCVYMCVFCVCVFCECVLCVGVFCVSVHVLYVYVVCVCVCVFCGCARVALFFRRRP